MNYKVIFNALIIIFIVHLVIQNINHNEVINLSNLTERFLVNKMMILIQTIKI